MFASLSCDLSNFMQTTAKAIVEPSLWIAVLNCGVLTGRVP
jgi:hypothetical protein